MNDTEKFAKDHGYDLQTIQEVEQDNMAETIVAKELRHETLGERLKQFLRWLEYED